jgi:predicted metalloprotease with PDZ domain
MRVPKVEVGLKYREAGLELEVTAVAPGGAAERAGIEPDDCIVLIDGYPAACVLARARLEAGVGRLRLHVRDRHSRAVLVCWLDCAG